MEHQRVALRIHTALYELINHTADVAEIRDVVDAVNVVDALAALGKYDEAVVRPLIDTATEGLRVASLCARGRMQIGQKHTAAIKRIVSLYDEAIAKFSQGTIQQANELVFAGSFFPDAEGAGRLVVLEF